MWGAREEGPPPVLGDLRASGWPAALGGLLPFGLPVPPSLGFQYTAGFNLLRFNLRFLLHCSYVGSCTYIFSLALTWLWLQDMPVGKMCCVAFHLFLSFLLISSFLSFFNDNLFFILKGC